MVRSIKDEIEFRLRRSKKNCSKHLDYILLKENEVYAFASDYCSAIEYTNCDGYLNYKKIHSNDWKNFFDEDFFYRLQNGFDISFISEKTHSLLWKNIKEYFPDDIQCKEGLKKYLKYCEDIINTVNHADDYANFIKENKKFILEIINNVKNCKSFNNELK